MAAVIAQVGSSRVLVETSDLPEPVEEEVDGTYGTQKTGITDDIRDAYSQLKALLKDMADDLGKELSSSKPHWPSEVQLEFGLSFSTSGNVWVLKTSGEMTCTVTMSWDTKAADAKV